MTASTVAACVVALKSFAWPHLEHWKGLSPDCSVAAVSEAWGYVDDGWRGSGWVGEEDEPRDLAWFSADAGFPDSVRVWVDGQRVVMLETEVLGDASHLKALVAKLGRPAAKLDAYFQVKMEKSEWVYPDRGLTLFVNPRNHVLISAVGYAPTTLENYRRNLRPITEPRTHTR
jgi:hypothetical protein